VENPEVGVDFFPRSLGIDPARAVEHHADHRVVADSRELGAFCGTLGDDPEPVEILVGDHAGMRIAARAARRISAVVLAPSRSAE
jgi:hypothetical protein